MLLWEHPSLPKSKCPFTQGRDIWWGDAVGSQRDSCDPEWLDAEAPLFLLYTSGSTGKPKGVLHSTGAGWGVELYSKTFKLLGNPVPHLNFRQYRKVQ